MAEPKNPAYADSLSTAIFNMVITLCQHNMEHMPPAQAKNEVADWLQRIVDGLRIDPDKEQQG